LTIFFILGPTLAVYIKSPFFLSLLVQATIAAILATGVGFLIRQNGMVSFGHAAFFGISAYAMVALLPSERVPAELIIVGAILATGLLAFLIALAIVKVHGIAFGMLTLAFGPGVYEASTRMRSVTGGHDGASLRRKLPDVLFGIPLDVFQSPKGMLIVAWLALATIVTLLWLFSRSSLGTLTEAIRDNEERVRFLGYRTLLPRALVFAISAVIAALSGVLFTIYNSFISPDSLHWSASGTALIMTIIGGSGAVWGPAVGAFAYFFLKEVVGHYTYHWLALVGIVMICVSVFFPKGLAGVFDRRVRKIGGSK